MGVLEASGGLVRKDQLASLVERVARAVHIEKGLQVVVISEDESTSVERAVRLRYKPLVDVDHLLVRHGEAARCDIGKESMGRASGVGRVQRFIRALSGNMRVLGAADHAVHKDIDGTS